ncbi:uncharacterized protein KY384_001972 [Bacidia gigantensis]|uniref:uncharacterized protein n=1 Tax=Bacidia gigantensis TaxID=2732470 RepID=UPI001D04548F|nr:uncharacterized protein KY384_001972 [Bacidia gigantensis]KAG8533189.1 hypothetical protein KY384_001972 [Bacidia gigantensis]
MAQYTDRQSNTASYASRWASIAIREQLAEIQRGIPSLPTPQNRNELAPITDTLDKETQKSSFNVGIIGAGCAGLFTAMIFDYLNERFKLNVTYEILESNGEDRIGGRLYSYYFKDVPNPGPHDYYDVGAMRFPNIEPMAPTFALFDLLEMKDSSSEEPKVGDLIPYYLTGPNNPQLYNDVRVVPKVDPLPKQGDPPKKEKNDSPTAKSFKVTGLLDWYEDEVPSKLIEDMIKPFTDKLKADPKKGWNFLMKFGDAYSVRQWFSKLYDYNTTEWLETYSYGTSWYDEALSEMVLEDINFAAPLNKWRCVEGGSQEIAKRMYNRVNADKNGKKTVTFSKRATKLARKTLTWKDEKGKKVPDDVVVRVSVKDEDKPREYDAVFNSAPLGAMQRMDLRGLNLNWGTKQAIRSLGYGASCKVGIRFKSLWWLKRGIIQGGSGKTDLPIRNCVYPSYNIYDYDPEKGVDKPGVLLCSYTWSQEAQRLGALIHRDSPKDEDELKALLVDNLTRLHMKDNSEYDKLHELIWGEYQSHYAYDWYQDTGTQGAFAYFGPGQFRNMYPWVVRNDGKHIIIGEAASAHHAWVVGALESAVRGVYQFLFAHSGKSVNFKAAVEAYNNDKIEQPYGPLPKEFDRTEDVKPITGPDVSDDAPLKHVAGDGEWARQQVIFEKIRQQQGGDQLDLAAVTSEEVKPLLEVAAAA